MSRRRWIGVALLGMMVAASSQADARARKPMAPDMRPQQIARPAQWTYNYRLPAWGVPAGYAASPQFGWAEIQAARAMVRRP